MSRNDCGDCADLGEYIEQLEEQLDELGRSARWAISLVGSLPLDMEPSRERHRRTIERIGGAA
jgi:hypothetical protein